MLNPVVNETLPARVDANREVVLKKYGAKVDAVDPPSTVLEGNPEPVSPIKEVTLDGIG